MLITSIIPNSFAYTYCILWNYIVIQIFNLSVSLSWTGVENLKKKG